MKKVYNILKDRNYKSKRAIDFFRGALFWDCKQDEILLGNDYDIVIERVLSHSFNLSRDFKILNKIYTLDVILHIIKERGNQIIGDEQIEQIAKEYKLNPKSFEKYFNR